MRAYSADFRFSVIRAYENGQGSQRQLAQFFGVSVSFIQNLLQRYRHTGSVLPKPHKGGNQGKIIQYLEIVDRLRRQWPDASLEEMCERLAVEVHILVSPATMSRALRRLKSRRGKRSTHPHTDRFEEQLAQVTSRSCAQPMASKETIHNGSWTEVEQTPLLPSASNSIPRPKT